jgi:hypothetical protein
MSGGTDEKHEKSQSVYKMFHLKFELGISWLQVISITASANMLSGKNFDINYIEQWWSFVKKDV